MLPCCLLPAFFACFRACLPSCLFGSLLAPPLACLRPRLLHLLLPSLLSWLLSWLLPSLLAHSLACIRACLFAFFLCCFFPSFFFSLIYYLVAFFRASLVARCQAHALQSLLAFNCLRFFIVDPGPKGGLQIPQLAYQHRRTGRGRLGISRVSEAVANGAGPVGRGRLLRGTLGNVWIHTLYVRDST